MHQDLRSEQAAHSSPRVQRRRISAIRPKKFAGEKAPDPVVKLIAIARPAIAQRSRTEIDGCELPVGSRLLRIYVRQGGRALYHQARQSARCIGAGVDIDTVSSDLDFETGRVAMYDCLAKILV